MTPFKQPAGGRLFANQELDFMDAENESLESPPSPSRGLMQPGARNRLFEDENATTEALTPARSFGGGSTKMKLKPLNLSFDDESSDDDDGGGGNSLGFHHRRKRLEKLAESGRRGNQIGTPTGSYGASSGDSMVTSPYVSPSSYIVTMDGRHVQSKNPFSPMVSDDTPTVMPAAAVATAASNAAAPSLPISLDGVSTSRLQKRNVPSPSKRYAPFDPSRNGYNNNNTDRTRGNYNNLSPIKENGNKHFHSDASMSCDSASPSMMAAHKIRRLGLNEDVHHYPRHNISLAVNTKGSPQMSEEISPTDVFAFPFGTPPAPPTPTKAQSPKGPETPFISRSGRRPTRRRAAGYLNNPDGDSDAIRSDGGAGVVPGSTASRFSSDFDVIEELGKGSFGAVYKVLSRLDGCMYAVKTALRKAKGAADRDRMLKEVYALAALSDQADPATFHIVRYHQAFMEEERLYIVTEVCNFNLKDEIQSSGGHLSHERRYKLLREMLLALEFIHRNDMVHLDIKPQNIFVKKDPPLDVFKLGDFGLVTKIQFHKDVEEGDSRYMSGELLDADRDRSIDLTKSDIWSLGLTVYEICLGRELPTNGEEWQAIRAGSLQPLRDTPYEMEMIIREMCNPNYTNRPGASDLLKRPQLLSKEQAKLALARKELGQAKLALAKQAHQLPPPKPAGAVLMRRNTWSGGSF